MFRVAQSRECKMPVANIAKVFAPTLVGYSSPHPEPVQMLSEAKIQPKVCIDIVSKRAEKLLVLPMSYRYGKLISIYLYMCMSCGKKFEKIPLNMKGNNF